MNKTAALSPRAKLGSFIAAEAAVSVLALVGANTVMDAIYLAAVPAWLVHQLVLPKSLLRLPRRRGLYAGLLAAAVAGYLYMCSLVSPRLQPSWKEWACALWYMAALHVIVFAMDAGIARGLGRFMNLLLHGRLPRAAMLAKTVVRVCLVVAVAGPFITASLLTHWVRLDQPAGLGEESGPAKSVAFVATDGTRLAGWFLPAYEKSSTAVVLAPGRDMERVAYLPYANLLRQNGCNVLLLDHRGQGGSDGHRNGMGVSEGLDVLAGVNFLKQAMPRGSEKVYAYGISEGASAALAAAAKDDRIEAVIADSPVPGPEEQVRILTAWMPGGIGSFARDAILVFASAEVGANLFEAGPERDMALLSNKPVLLIHGAADKQVSRRLIDRIAAAAKGPAMLWNVHGAGHGECLLASNAGYERLVSRVLSNLRHGQPAFEAVRAGS